MAWSFISAASSLCITLRYHRTPASNDPNDASQADRERLFWTVYAIDKALALRLGRLSNIADSEVTLSIDRCDIREAKLGATWCSLVQPSADGLFAVLSQLG